MVDENFHDYLASIKRVYPPPEKDDPQEEFIKANLKWVLEKSKVLEYVCRNWEIRNDRDKCLIKESFLSNKSLSYYVNSLKSLSQPHKNDAVSVNVIINKQQKETYNCVLLYKPQGQNTVYGPTSSKMLPNNSLAIGLQTAEQKEIVIKNSSKILCIDFTHQTNEYGFYLLNLIVPDEFGIGYPVAHFITNKLRHSNNVLF
ncbi:c2H2-type domain-containing protein [Trichonephila inaurata madagascariensis]|uniref:C2H2-type domain-containing protein n=1 Tax=Trichonephila inaurata madagascariensis TaxID=2747483 RepID=A0A8X6Y078_9ARAC|nr:c2H2-type domain-containing protein [Trichonephila inaurata madagascariensis]